MTSAPFTSGAPGPDDHPDVAEISALTEGLLSPDRASTVRAHLTECVLCTDVRSSLEEIRDTLGTLPGPPRMPADVAGRIDAALAAEALLDASRPHDASAGIPAASRTPDARAVSRETALGAEKPGAEEPAEEPEHVSRETGAVPRPASGRPADRPSGHPAGSTGPGRGSAVRTAPRRTRRRRTALLAAAGAVAVLGVGGLVAQGFTSASPGTGQGPTAASGGSAALEHHVHRLLADSSASQQGPQTSSQGRTPGLSTEQSPSGDAPMAGGATAVPSCVREGIGRTDAPLAANERTPYQGHDGYLVVYAHHGDPQRVDVYVVDASCVDHTSGGPGDVLLKHTYPRR